MVSTRSGAGSKSVVAISTKKPRGKAAKKADPKVAVITANSEAASPKPSAPAGEENSLEDPKKKATGKFPATSKVNALAVEEHPHEDLKKKATGKASASSKAIAPVEEEHLQDDSKKKATGKAPANSKANVSVGEDIPLEDPKKKTAGKALKVPATQEVEAVPESDITIEACKQCNSFKVRADKLKTLVLAERPDLKIAINPEKPRRGYFEVRAGSKVVLSLPSMNRPFPPLKALVVEDLAKQVIAQLPAEK